MTNKKSKILLIIFFSFQFLIHGQENDSLVNEHMFNSVFQNLKEGSFKGTANGILLIEKNSKEILLDFQGSNLNLNIIADTNEVYDVSIKSYTAHTTSGMTKIKYQTYSMANQLAVFLNNQWFKTLGFDGGYDMNLSNLEYKYFKEINAEYLVIQIKKEIKLTNWFYLIEKYEPQSELDLTKIKKKEEIVTVKPYSTIVFAINF